MKWWLAVAIAVVLAQAAHALTNNRFYIEDVSKMGTYQTAYLVRDRQDGGHCILVVEVSGNPFQTFGITSQPWPCR